MHGGGYGGIHSDSRSSEIWVQCAWCYDQWQAEVEKSKWFWPKWLAVGIIINIITTMVMHFFILPGQGHTVEDKNPILFFFRKERAVSSLKFPLSTPLSLAVVLVLVIFLGHIFRP